MSANVQSDELRLERVVPTDEQVIVLYELLKSRTHTISHNSIPSYSEHTYFVRNNPYRVWFLVRFNNICIGSIYVTTDNTLGINILESHLDKCLDSVVSKAISEIEPLPELTSVRAGCFSVNVPFSNKVMALKLDSIGFIPTQITYKKQ